tara:strand:- start:3112 stop:3654 length:543 start_codon:yes stop_codon:yes gene_type:complete
MATQALCNDNIISEEPGIVGPIGAMGPTANIWYGKGTIMGWGGDPINDTLKINIQTFYKKGSRWSDTPNWHIPSGNSGMSDFGIAKLDNFLVSTVPYTAFVDILHPWNFKYHYPNTAWPPYPFDVKITEAAATELSVQIYYTGYSINQGSSESPQMNWLVYYPGNYGYFEFSFLIIANDD